MYAGEKLVFGVHNYLITLFLMFILIGVMTLILLTDKVSLYKSGSTTICSKLFCGKKEQKKNLCCLYRQTAVRIEAIGVIKRCVMVLLFVSDRLVCREEAVCVMLEKKGCFCQRRSSRNNTDVLNETSLLGLLMDTSDVYCV